MAENDENQIEESLAIQDLKSQLSTLAAAVDLNRRQLEQVLIFSAQQQSLLDQAVQALNTQSMTIARMERTETTSGAKISDMEMNLDRMDETLNEIQQGVQGLPSELQQIKTAISNIRIYQSVDY